MNAFSSIILTATLVKRLAAVSRRFLTGCIREAQLAATRFSVPTWYRKYLLVCPCRNIGIPSTPDIPPAVAGFYTTIGKPVSIHKWYSECVCFQRY